MAKLITSPSNPLIKRIHSLHEKKFRVREGLFLAEGMRVVTEAVEAGVAPAWLIHGPDMEDHPVLQRLVAATEAAGGEVIETSADVLRKLSRKDNPQSVLGVFTEFGRRLPDLDRNASYVWIVCESLKDPGNLGTILRTADAVGAGGVILLDNSCDPYSVEAVRASMGALFTVPLVQAKWEEFLPWLRSGPGFLVGASLNTDHDYQAIAYPAPTFLFMGNEQSGLPESYEQACDALVKIPMRGKADSLNVAIATAVIVYEVLNQTRRR
mgnify:FL=1